MKILPAILLLVFLSFILCAESRNIKVIGNIEKKKNTKEEKPGVFSRFIGFFTHPFKKKSLDNDKKEGKAHGFIVTSTHSHHHKAVGPNVNNKDPATSKSTPASRKADSPSANPNSSPANTSAPASKLSKNNSAPSLKPSK